MIGFATLDSSAQVGLAHEVSIQRDGRDVELQEEILCGMVVGEGELSPGTDFPTKAKGNVDGGVETVAAETGTECFHAGVGGAATAGIIRDWSLDGRSQFDLVGVAAADVVSGEARW